MKTVAHPKLASRNLQPTLTSARRAPPNATTPTGRCTPTPRLVHVGQMPLDLYPATVADLPAAVALVNSAYRGDSSRAGWTTEADLLGGQRTDVDTLRSQVLGDTRALL